MNSSLATVPLRELEPLLGEAFPLRAAVLWVMDKLHRLQAAADLIGRRRRVALRRVIVAVADDDVTQGGGGWLRASKGVDAVPGLHPGCTRSLRRSPAANHTIGLNPRARFLQ